MHRLRKSGQLLPSRALPRLVAGSLGEGHLAIESHTFFVFPAYIKSIFTVDCALLVVS